jgi:hypothetical protein
MFEKIIVCTPARKLVALALNDFGELALLSRTKTCNGYLP